jgi:hypothetical protein
MKTHELPKGTFLVQEFLQQHKGKILVRWVGHEDLTWQPIPALKEDLGDSYEDFLGRMKKPAKSKRSSNDDNLPLSSLIKRK